jgi:hypothetical protein
MDRRVVALAASVMVILLGPLASGCGVGAASFVEKTFDQLVGEADDIVVGTVESAAGRRTASGAIVTDVALTVHVSVKGQAMERLVLQVLGGTVGAATLEVVGSPRFVVGQTYVIFAADNGRVILPLVGGDQGLFQVRRDVRTGEALVFTADGRPVRVATTSTGRLEFGAAYGTPATLRSFLSAIVARLER